MANTPDTSLDLPGMSQAESAWSGVREGDGPVVDFGFTPKDVALGAVDAAARWAQGHRGHIKGVLYTAGLGLVLHSLSHSGVAFGQEAGPTPSSPSPDQGSGDTGLVNGIVSTILERPLTAMGWITGASAVYGAAYSTWGVLRSALEVQKYNNGPEGLAELEVLTEQYESKRKALRASLAAQGLAGEKLEAEYKGQSLESGLTTEPKLRGYDWAKGRTLILLTAFSEAVEGADVAVKLILLPQLFTAEGRAMVGQALELTKNGVSETEAVTTVLQDPRIATLAVIGFFGAVATFNDVKTLFQQRILASSGKQRQQAA